MQRSGGGRPATPEGPAENDRAMPRGVAGAVEGNRLIQSLMRCFETARREFARRAESVACVGGRSAGRGSRALAARTGRMGHQSRQLKH